MPRPDLQIAPGCFEVVAAGMRTSKLGRDRQTGRHDRVGIDVGGHIVLLRHYPGKE
jgi:hypothetical protein